MAGIEGSAMKYESRFHDRVLVLVAMIWCCLGPIGVRADAPAPAARELATFLPLVCDQPRATTNGTECAHLVGFPSLSGPSPRTGPPSSDLRLAGIFYGSFTRAGADQAYLTYYSSTVEGHVTNFGGGILFERTNGIWKLVRWYRGGQMDRCAPIPATNPLKLLCVTGSTNQGESDGSVQVTFLRATQLGSDPPLLQSRDTRAAAFGDKNGCYTDVPKGQAYLLWIGFPFTRNGQSPSIALSASPYFAQTQVHYETAADIAIACSGPHQRKVRESTSTVRFSVRSGRVVMTSPVTFYHEPE